MKMYRRGFLAIIAMIGITSGAMAFISVQENPMNPKQFNAGSGVVSVETELVQDKVLQGSDGRIGLALTITGAAMPAQAEKNVQPVDLVVVLDRSGSMEGRKIDNSRKAVIRLMEKLSPEDRIALIAYSNRVSVLSPLVNMTSANRENLAGRIRQLESGGGTNLGGGLQLGLSTFKSLQAGSRQRKVILISDGLANQGVTSVSALGRMAANGTEYNLAVSTVGVGYDFNEILMTAIADHGSGNYYFLENPQAFARVFEKEFETARAVVASGLEIRIPLKDGVRLVDAGGFPVTQDGNTAVIKPGDLLSGQQRKLFLTMQIPTEEKRKFSIGGIVARYLHNGDKLQSTNMQMHLIKCISDKKEVVASIDGEIWSEQVVKEDYNRLKEQVASAIRKGKKSEALQKIQEYEIRNSAINDSIASPMVSINLEKDVQLLRQDVEETFTGAPAAVAEKKKQQAKTLQYESYRIRRDKK